MGTVLFGNDHFAAITGYRDYVQGNLTICHVYYIEGLGYNLFLVGQFCDGDLEVAFRSNTCYVWNLEGDDLLIGSRESNLYTISISELAASSPVYLVNWLLKFKYDKDHLCSSCEQGKSKKASFPSQLIPRTESKLELIHMDLCVPIRVESINGKKYILVIIDDYSRCTWVYFLRTKDEAPDTIINFINQVQRNLKAQILKIRTDNGTKIKNEKLRCSSCVLTTILEDSDKMLDTEDTIIFKLDSQEIVYTVNMFRDTLNLLVETLENPFVAPVNIEIIESFINMVGYQGVVDKVSAFYTKNLAQPWQTMFKVFNRCLTIRTYGHNQTKINILQLFHAVVNRMNVDYATLLWWDFKNCVSQKKNFIQYPHFTKLIIADLMKRFPSIPPRIEEDYHSSKDGIPLVSVYTMGNVIVQGMMIPDAFLTEEIRATDDDNEFETVFVNVVVPINQPQLVVSTQGTHSSSQKSLKITIRQKQVSKGEKDEQSYDDVDVFDNRLEPVDEKRDDEMGSLEIRTKEMQTLITTTPKAPRKILSSDKNIDQELTDNVTHKKVDQVLHEIIPQLSERATYDLIENNLKPSIAATIIKDRDAFRSEVPDLVSQEFNAQALTIIKELFKNYVQNNVIQVHHPTITTSTETTSSADLQHQLYLKMRSNLQDQADDPALWDALKRKFKKSSFSNTSCRDDEFHLQRHDDHQGDDAPPEGEKRVKRLKTSKS
ncbi:putative RNA-directed DNA polymerase [Tanacetum coccineum]|uniref:RNA-directed DNA polymerase n=1 Tax=Tanacetum coccineum TaxID=301880 RepID=A0ABQ4WVG9_9ASTR